MRLAYLALTFIAIAGCSNSDSAPDASIPSDPACPDRLPTNGTPCSLPGPDPSGYEMNCHYYNRCTRRSDGYIASCDNGSWTIAADQPRVKCPAIAPEDGDICDCAAYYRDRQCAYACVEGGLRVGQCNVGTYRWSVQQPTACTVLPDGGPIVDGFL